MTSETLPSTPARPTPLVVGAAIAALEGVALAGWGVYDMIIGLADHSADLARSEYGGVILLLMGLLPILAGRALFRLRRWGRSPALLTNSICLPVAYYMWQGNGPAPALAVLVAALGLAGIITLLNPRVTAVLYR